MRGAGSAVKKVLAWLVALGVVLLAVAGIAAVTLFTATPAPGFAEPATVLFAPGTSSRAIATELESRGVISSRWPFMALRALRPQAKLKAGEYEFEQPVSAWAAFEKIAQGKVLFHAVTIPEGLNRFEVADAVAKTGLVSRDEFLKATENPARVAERFPEAKTLEGFLFPDTYLFRPGATAADVIKAMLDNFEAHLPADYRSQVAGRNLTLYQAITLASLIEREAVVDDERSLIASVIYNRLAISQALEIDATVQYAVAAPGDWWPSIAGLDFRAIVSPYNTYYVTGLPAGPIANPGLKSILAAASPAASDYLYYRARCDGSGRHNFAATYEEHLANACP